MLQYDSTKIPYNYRLGGNVSIEKTLFKTISKNHFFRTCQFFMANPKSYGCRIFDSKDKANVLEYCTRTNRSFCIHAPYLVNLAKSPDHEHTVKSLNCLQTHLNQLENLPGQVLFHIGTQGNIQNVIDNINTLEVPKSSFKWCKKHLLLENCAGEGAKIGKNWEELSEIYKNIDTSRVGLCLDTQHSFGAGLSQFQTEEEVTKIFDICDQMCGGIDVIHLNDSQVPFGSKKDRHENIGQGFIWKDNTVGLKSLLEQSFERSVNIILETHDIYNDGVKLWTQYVVPKYETL